MKNFFKNYPGKLDFVIGIILGFTLFFVYRVGLGVEEKWPYVLLLILSIVVYMISEDQLLMKFVAVVNILYSIFMLVQEMINPDFLNNLEEGNQTVIGIVIWIFVFLGKLTATASGIFVLFFGFIVGVGWRLVLYVFVNIPKFLRTFFWSKVRGPIPNVQCLVKGDKRIYLQQDFLKKEVLLIYRQGHKKKILDTYQGDEYEDVQYSLKKHSKNGVIVQKYSTITFKQIGEKEYATKIQW